MNALTSAPAKVGSYAFTTLDPHLGVIQEYILADIPGLIEGAAEGKGLGHKFLRHVKRTKILLHLVSLENDDVVATYLTVRKELEKYGDGLPEKPETIILTKTDMVDEATIAKAQKDLIQYNKDIITVTILDDAAIKKCSEEITTRLRA